MANPMTPLKRDQLPPVLTRGELTRLRNYISGASDGDTPWPLEAFDALVSEIEHYRSNGLAPQAEGERIAKLTQWLIEIVHDARASGTNDPQWFTDCADALLEKLASLPAASSAEVVAQSATTARGLPTIYAVFEAESKLVYAYDSATEAQEQVDEFEQTAPAAYRVVAYPPPVDAQKLRQIIHETIYLYVNGHNERLDLVDKLLAAIGIERGAGDG